MKTDWLRSASYIELVQFMREEPADSEFFSSEDRCREFWNELEKRIRSRLLEDIPTIREYMGWKRMDEAP